MKSFFKPTKARSILTIILVICFITISWAWTFYGLNLCGSEIPGATEGPTPTPIPANIPDTINDFSQIASSPLNSNGNCLPQNSQNPDEYMASYTLAEFIFYMFTLIPAYLISCIVIFLANEMKKQKNTPASKTK